METGVTVHLGLAKVMSEPGKKQFVEKMEGAEKIRKRAMDIMGGLVGCTITVLLLPFVGTAIYLASPGRLLAQEREKRKNGSRCINSEACTWMPRHEKQS